MTLHELSIAEHLVAVALDALREAEDREPSSRSRVEEVRLEVGLLAGVEKDSLLFCYDIATEGTPLAGSRLVIDEVPVVIFCGSCRAEHALAGLQSFLCPVCGRPSSDVRRGRELELVSIRLADRTASPAD